MALNEVLVRSEQAKWALSDRMATRVTLQIGAERRTYELTRDEFEAQTASLMDRTRRLTEEALGEANATWGTIAGVLLVGGFDPDADGPAVRGADGGGSPRARA